MMAGMPVQVGDQSDFVNVLGRVLKDAGPRLGAALSDIHYRCQALRASAVCAAVTLGRMCMSRAVFVSLHCRRYHDIASCPAHGGPTPQSDRRSDLMPARYLVDKLGSSFAPRFAEALFRCRRISEAGSQQLLLDTQGIRGLLLEFPASGALPTVS